MRRKSKIQWCDDSKNAVIGCEKCSPGCANCYAEFDTPARVLRASGIETWGPQGVRHTVEGFRKAMLAMNRRPWVCDNCGHATAVSEWHGSPGDECPKCFSRQGHRRRVFVNSNSDWLDGRWPVKQLADFLDVLRLCPDLHLITCTKRPELWRERMLLALKHNENAGRSFEEHNWLLNWYADAAQPPRNITVLATVENQAMAEERIPHLLKIPAARRGLSMEPLLGPVSLDRWIEFQEPQDGGNAYMELDWLIIGGESGAKARPCNVEWIRSLVQQGKAAGVATFVKQLGSNAWADPQKDLTKFMWDIHSHRVNDCRRVVLSDKKGADPAEWPMDLRVRQWMPEF